MHANAPTETVIPGAPVFGPLVATLAAHGIPRTTAFELVRSGELPTFTIGRKRFVRIEDLRELADRKLSSKGGH